jgi:diguanylate cyclase (GGDEF)-like protein
MCSSQEVALPDSACTAAAAGPRSIEFVITDDRLQSRLQAIQTSDPAASADERLACAWHLRERDGDRALAFAAQVEAWAPSCAERASLQRTGRIHLIRGKVLLLRGDESAPAQAQAAQALFERIGDDIGLADAFWLWSRIHMLGGDIPRQTSALEDCAAAADRAGDAVRATAARAWLARQAVRRDPAKGEADWGARLAAQPPVPGLVCNVEVFRFSHAWAAGDYDSAIQHLLRLRADALATGQIRQAIIAQVNIGSCFGNLQDYETALDWTRRTLALAREKRWPQSIAPCLSQLGGILLRLERLDEAHAVLTEALSAPAMAQPSNNKALLVQYLGDVQLRRQQYADALQWFRTLERLADSLQIGDFLQAGLRGQADALEALGHAREALAMARRCEAWSSQRKNASQLIEDMELLARIATGHGEELRDELGPDDALHYLERAVELGATIEGYTVPSRVWTALGQEHARRGNHRRAYDAAVAAGEALTRTTTAQALSRAAALRISHETDLALADARHQRSLAQAEARRAAQLQAMTETLERLGGVGRIITMHLREEDVIAALDAQLAGLLDTTYFSVHLLDDDERHLRCAFGKDGATSLAPQSIPMDAADSDIARCAREGREIGSPDGTALVAPLSVGQRLHGVMAIRSPQAGAYQEREKLVFRSVCAYGAIALANAKSTRQLEEKNLQLERAQLEQREASLTDPLTGLRNRRFLLQQIDDEAALAVRRTRQRTGMQEARDLDTTFFLIDVDHFKSVNDEYGHAAGDEVLVQVAARLREVARETDFVVRWGGEEFLLVARGTDRSQASRLAERLRSAVATSPFKLGDGRNIERTCSIGYASFPYIRRHPQALSWSQVVELADHALYRAKRSGRNRWVGVGSPESVAADDLFARLTSDPEAAQQAGCRLLIESR